MNRYRINKPSVTNSARVLLAMGFVVFSIPLLLNPVRASGMKNYKNLAGVCRQPADTSKKESRREVLLKVIPGHPWLPPFGLERVGRPLQVEVIFPGTEKPQTKYFLVAYFAKNETERIDLSEMKTALQRQKLIVELKGRPSKVVLLAKSLDDGTEKEVSALTVDLTPFEAEAVVGTEEEVNPVDLGAVFVPDNWLLIEQGHAIRIELAMLTYSESLKNVQATAWFGSSLHETVAKTIPLEVGRKSQTRLSLKYSSAAKTDDDSLHITVKDGFGHVVWVKDIRVMVARQKAGWPVFGAMEAKLRYGPPISVRRNDSTFTSLDYNQGWDKSLNDIVVSLPNGSRFVFWRGSNYVPFWASKYNTGICYEWAETSRKDAVDCVEPLMDKELRYGRVTIVESTHARVHVRWSYQACDFNYKVWGDKVVEDYYFYPDGYGTRVLTLESEPDVNYELSEFIIITPQGAVPFSVLPRNLLKLLFPDGEKREMIFPYDVASQGWKLKSRNLPAIFRARLHKDETSTAIYFCPNDNKIPQHIYAPFHDSGLVVTPCYWGSHWPLSRGQTTCWSISDLVNHTPAANSVITWDIQQSAPLRDALFQTLDAKGQPAFMRFRTYAWLIGFNNSPDSLVIQRALSFAQPPSVSVLKGGQLDFEPYSPERAAMAIKAETSEIVLSLLPANICVNPVFEISGWENKPVQLWVNGALCKPGSYAWDGKVLWIQSTFSDKTVIRVSVQ